MAADLTEETLLDAIKRDPYGGRPRLAYADWLDQRGDFRGEFVRLHLMLRLMAQDELRRKPIEFELRRLRRRMERDWLAIIEPESGDTSDGPPLLAPLCMCFDKRYRPSSPEVTFHFEPQDTECPAWKKLLALIGQAASDGRTKFDPAADLGHDDWFEILTLPPTIAKLKSVTSPRTGMSQLVRLPPEIGEMTAIEEFTPYSSYRLHWFPYEITRCKQLRESAVSTRALYGNYKYRPPFPRLGLPVPSPDGVGDLERPATPGHVAPIHRCSVCERPFEDLGLHRVWISLRVATDVLPLLVNACSEDCIASLPKPADGYVQHPHRGGWEVEQPPSYG